MTRQNPIYFKPITNPKYAYLQAEYNHLQETTVYTYKHNLTGKTTQTPPIATQTLQHYDIGLHTLRLLHKIGETNPMFNPTVLEMLYIHDEDDKLHLQEQTTQISIPLEKKPKRRRDTQLTPRKKRKRKGKTL